MTLVYQSVAAGNQWHKEAMFSIVHHTFFCTSNHGYESNP